MSRHPTASQTRAPHLHTMRLLSIIVVFCLGATLMLPTPAAAQSLSSDVSGRVTDAFGDAVADAQVSARKHVSGDLWQLHETETDESGAYRLTGLSSGTWNLTVAKDGYARHSAQLETSSGQDVTRNITLKALQVRAYSVTVVDGETEAPIRGALVTITGSDGQTHAERNATTDEDGTASLRLFARYNEIRITRSGYDTYHDHVYQPTTDIERTASLRSVPAQSATIIGQVVDQDGNPVQAQVELRPINDHHPEPRPMQESSDNVSAPAPSRYHARYNSTTTDAEGRFTMHAYAGDHTLSANRRGHLVNETTITLGEGQTRDVTLRLEALPERSVTLSGTVTDDATGEPVPGAQVNVQVPAYGDHAWAEADADGAWSIQVRPGYTLVEVARYWWHGPVYATTDSTSSSADGAAEPAMADAAIRAPDEPGERYLPRHVTFTTSEGASRTVDTTLTKRPEAQTTVVGYVIDAATDTAIPGARVSFQNHESGEWGQATTDADGSYRFALYGGWHTVRVWADGHLPMAMDLDAPDEGDLRQDLAVQAGRIVQEGWWDPSHNDGDCCWIAEDGAKRGEAAPAAATSSDSTAGGSSTDDASMEAEGPRTLQGSGGGLGPYDPNTKGSLADDTHESPMPFVASVVGLLGVLAVVAGLRRSG